MRRYRLEEMAVESGSARAALRGMNDLTLILAGAQFAMIQKKRHKSLCRHSAAN
ncbi:hypothetical protein [Salinivibrio socompensis]|uniref:hypothetical protein n=1 Tax=Salinivibrio socompensis TaxID=1510206 RepID=UPI0004B75092|nr:hypothetical protein [Salinivibrio socompensis]